MEHHIQTDISGGVVKSLVRQHCSQWSIPAFSGVPRVNLLGVGSIVEYAEVSQLFNSEIYPVRISIQK